MDKQTLFIAVLSSSGLFAVIGALMNGLFTKRRLGAEATEIITKAASGVVQRLEDEIGRRIEEAAVLRAEHSTAMLNMRQEQTAAIDKLEREHHEEREQWRRVLQLHVAWDYIAIERLSHLGVDLPPPPPIMPSGAPVGSEG
jgi:hypothetical protein